MSQTPQTLLTCLIVLCLVTVRQSQSGVIQITYNNLEKVLASYEEIYSIFHNPQCVHSRQYMESFLKIQSSKHSDADLRLGIVDCLREVQLCQKYHFDQQFPKLVRFYINDQQKAQAAEASLEQTRERIQVEVLDQYDFLVQYAGWSESRDKFVHKKIIQAMQTQPGFVVVILEEEGLPVEAKNRISKQSKHIERVFYIQPSSVEQPSKLSESISNLVNGKEGCWIMHYNPKQQKIQHYYCGQGHSFSVLQKYINHFLQGRLARYVFQADSSSLSKLSLNTEMLKQIPLRVQDDSKCRAVYFFSEKCPSCSKKDIPSIQSVINRLKLDQKVELHSFSLDQNELPYDLEKNGMKRVPELLIQCAQGSRFFGKIFFERNLENFFSDIFNKKETEQINQENIMDADVDSASEL